MDEGIGRTGYRLLAFLWTALGFLGTAALWLGIETGLRSVLWAGLGLLGTSFLVLFAFTWLTPNEPRPASRRAAGGLRWPRFGRDRGRPQRSPPAPAARTAAPPAAAPSGLDFEFQDTIPAADAAPERMVLPDAFSDADRPPPAAGQQAAMTVTHEPRFREHDPAAWPGQKTRGGQSTWTAERKALEEARRKAETRPVHKDLAQKYTRNAPVVRDILAGNDAKPTAPPPGGKTRGKCGDCGTVILAPPQRPIRLRCPKCSKVTLLKA